MTKVSKIMSSNVATLKKGASISEASKLISNKVHGCVVIVEGKKPIGVVTESDILSNLVSNKPKKKVEEIMSSPVTTLDQDIKLEKANKIIDTMHFRKYPVVKNDELVGILSDNEIVHAINDNIKFHRNLQNAVLIIFVLFEFFVFVVYERISSFLPV